MPVYEEKLISPLAVRFTQEHIKTIFRDGHIVEDTCAQIEAGPGVGDYDVVLRVPFPTIEIIRWSAPGAKESDRHWYTLDNRRLYCLQRAAAQLWPKRVGAAVEILYADPGAVRRKYDSTTFGRSVTVSPSCKVAALFRWEWQAEVANAKFVTPLKEVQDDRCAMEAAAADDKKDNVGELANVSGTEDTSLSTVARALAATGAVAKARSSPASSTAAPSERDDDESVENGGSSTGDASPANGRERRPAARAVGRASAGEVADHTDKYHKSRQEVASRAIAEITAQLRADGRVRMTSWAQSYGKALGGVGLRQFMERHPETFVVSVDGAGKWSASLVDGEPLGEAPASLPKSGVASAQDEVPAARRPRATQKASGSAASTAGAPHGNEVVKRGIQEIQAQLDPRGVPCYVRIPDWNGRYMRHLGDLRSFAESRPDLFVVVPCGNGFRVASAAAAHSARQRALMAHLAVRVMQAEALQAAHQFYAHQAFF
mmetsp:Transcript_107315/g.308794  ORF Transcript_107315/g.308794 Transcript_107315/m.308794 type:complete len:488 (-) Transcript_107315:115-1578(-)